ncbi:MAG: Ig-like domain-containing protein [Longimicrobiaceae bacterium]
MKLSMHHHFLSAAFLAALLSCTGDSPTGAGRAPAQLQAAGGGGQTGTAGTALTAPLVVRATDTGGQGMRGVAVSWSIRSGGGTLSTASSVTDDAGEARTQWTLGQGTGEQSVAATVQGLAPVLIIATAVPGAPAILHVSAGNAQVGVVGTAVSSAPTVQVTDRYSNPVQGVEVGWAVTSGGGSVSPPASRTDAAGNASTRWVLGPTVGANGLTAAVSGLPTAVFTVAATPPPVAARVEKSSGDAQTGVVGEALADSVAVRVLSADGRAVPGVAVSWSTLDGSLSSSSKATDAAGISRVGWTLGGGAGTQGVEARVSGLDGSPVVFRATGKAGRVTVVKKHQGDAQRGPVGSELHMGLGAVALDRYGNPVAGARVAWTTSGGGSISAQNSSTPSSGEAYGRWKLGSAEGPQTATVTIDGVSAEFTATAGPVVSVASITLDSGSRITMGEGAGRTVVATMRDSAGNALGGRTVTWTTSAPAVASVSSLAPNAGQVTGLALGETTITATSEGRSASVVVTVTTAPKLTGFSRTPASVDVTSAPGVVEFTVSATDAGPGVRAVTVSVDPPTLGGRYWSCTTTSPWSGTPRNGVWKCTITVPQGAEAGTWKIIQIDLTDEAGTYAPAYDYHLAARGYPTTVTVKNSGPPPTRPVMTGLSISPTTVDVANADGVVEFTLSANASAGIGTIYVIAFQGDVVLGCPTVTLVGGTAANGTWKCRLTVRKADAAGTWQVGITIGDNAGYTRLYSSAALQAAGFPSSFVVKK